MDANVRYMEAEVEAQQIENREELPIEAQEEVEIRASSMVKPVLEL